ncbi:hypothetical protein GCK72_001991 [Caenorhabditis remanei]|uniref:Uncharacterized protein n=1 Tax=Caenorhabditis remanei TaxID=31234 RepID=A0A6A5HV78_CAERE|nr:hypothetical protein GCK72_001991 [Caenorhabditis remanei]KAF1770173.1 hypothetical protein GCK72_001991 [Caenorhabditis remanei]
MEYHREPAGTQTPQFCCFPARLLVCILSVIGIAQNGVSICFSTFFKFRYQVIIPFNLTWILLNILLLFGAFCNNERALRWSLKVVIACMILTGIYIMTVPVMISSFFASGMEFPIIRNDGNYDNFIIGMVYGYCFELISIFLIGAQILKYILVNRLWEYAKTTVSVAESRYETV